MGNTRQATVDWPCSFTVTPAVPMESSTPAETLPLPKKSSFSASFVEQMLMD